MPVIVAPDDYARWLDVGGEPPIDLVAPYPADAMRFEPVSTRVNAVRNDDASLIEPVEVTVEAEGDLVSIAGADAQAESPQKDLF
jgi:putative SOS response-associated peptidase YedK